MTIGAERPPGRVRAVIVTNIPAPYRIPVYERIDGLAGVDLHVVYTAERESNRHWVLPPTTVRSVTLRSFVLRWRGRYIHFTAGVVRALRSAHPDVIVTTGFNPPQLVAVLYAVLARVPHVAQTDGTVASEATLSPLHRVVRRLVAKASAAFVAASEEGRRLQRSYGAGEKPMFLSPLAIDNARFAAAASGVKDLDLLFSGQLSDVKDPLFALAAARDAAEVLGRRLTMAFLGAGPLEGELRRAAEAASDRVDVVLAGFQQQDALPGWYGRARAFLFPTHWDPWGLVANEAAAAALPQIISPAAGAAGDLVRDGIEGFVRPLDASLWRDLIVDLLDDEECREAMGAAACARVAQYDFNAAADGLRAGILAGTAARRHS